MFVVYAVLFLVFCINSIGRAALTPLLGGLSRMENVKTGLLLDIAGAQTGSSIVVSTYSASKNSQRWNYTSRDFLDGYLYGMTNPGSTEYIFVNPAAGNGLTARPLPTLFYIKGTLWPFTYTLTLPLTTLAVTSPDKAGGQVTLQEYNKTDPSQLWFFTST